MSADSIPSPLRVAAAPSLEPPAFLRYRGRIAPSPTGYLHLGHARTFAVAHERARRAGGTLIFRSEDLDVSRVRPEFEKAMYEDLRWFGLEWQEGPDVGGPHEPYVQSQRRASYAAAFSRLRELGLVYPCSCTRRDIQQALQAPHAGDEEPLYPGTCRPPLGLRAGKAASAGSSGSTKTPAWRFRVSEGEPISFLDSGMGPQTFVAGRDFGDFVVWRQDDSPSYQLSVVVDDAAMQVTEVVRGEDLLLSTARQLLLYRALGIAVPPRFHHCPLVRDEKGQRLAKRSDAMSLRALREEGRTPEELRRRLSLDQNTTGQSGWIS